MSSISDEEEDTQLSYYGLISVAQESAQVETAESDVTIVHDVNASSNGLQMEGVESSEETSFSDSGVMLLDNLTVKVNNDTFAAESKPVVSAVSTGSSHLPALPPVRSNVIPVSKWKYAPSPEVLEMIHDLYGSGIMNPKVFQERKKECPLPEHKCFSVPELDGNLDSYVATLKRHKISVVIGKFYDETLKDNLRRLLPIFGPLTIGAQHAKNGTLTNETAYDMFLRAAEFASQLQFHMNLQRRVNVLHGLRIKNKDTEKLCRGNWPDIKDATEEEALMGPVLTKTIVEETNTLARNSKVLVHYVNQRQGVKPQVPGPVVNKHQFNVRQQPPYVRMNSNNKQYGNAPRSGNNTWQQSQPGTSSGGRGRGGQWPSRSKSGYVLSDSLLPDFPVSPDSVDCPVGGRSRHFLSNWECLTSDPWVLNTIQGIKFDFVSIPVQDRWPPEIQFSVSDQVIIDAEIATMLEKRAIAPVDDESSVKFVSQLFIVSKKEGGIRPIINLRRLNEFIRYEHFKMEGLHCLPELLTENCYMIKIDLHDAYFTIYVDEEYQDYLVFSWRSKLYKFRCLPFGLCAAPRIFTKVLKPVAAILRKLSVKLVIYIDDFLITARAFDLTNEQAKLCIKVLKHLGFIINEKKSILTPSQNMPFLGFDIDSVTMTISLPSEKVSKIVSLCNNFLSRSQISLRELAVLLGNFTSTARAILPCLLRCRSLQLLQRQALHSGYASYDNYTSLTPEAKEDIKLWSKSLQIWNGKSISTAAPSVFIETDASMTGWGAICDNRKARGIWSATERLEHINYLELLAVFLGVKSFLRDRNDIHVRILSDNTTAIAYLNRQGGTHSVKLNTLTVEIWEWCLDAKIFISAEHIPGKFNQEADYASRSAPDSSDWCLDSSVFNTLNNCLGPCSVDLFASYTNAQLERFFAWRPDPFAERVDAFAQSWKDLQGYGFPPFSLVGKCLQQCSMEKCVLVIVVPLWPLQPWFPVLLEMLVRVPLILPGSVNLLVNAQGEYHPLIENRSLTLMACLISGNCSEQEGFQIRQSLCTSDHGRLIQQSNIRALIQNGYIGVVKGRLIPCQHL